MANAELDITLPLCWQGDKLSDEVKGKCDFATSLPYDTVIIARWKIELLDNSDDILCMVTNLLWDVAKYLERDLDAIV